MKNNYSQFLNYYDREITLLISNKYKIDSMNSFKKYIYSKTYKMVSNPELEMWQFGIPAIFDMWECEQVTGTPLNSVYLRSEKYD